MADENDLTPQDDYLGGVQQYSTPANYGDLMLFVGNYFSCGELGVIFEEKGWPSWVIKIVNQDAEDDVNLMNMEQTDFFQTVFRAKKYVGVPPLKFFWRGQVDEMVKNHLQHIILSTGGDKKYEALEGLALNRGDEIGVWIMERLASVGTNHHQPLAFTLKGVAEAAADIYTEYGYIVEDLHDSNYGQRENGEFVIFDPAFVSEIKFPDVYARFPEMTKGERMAWFIENTIWVRTKEGVVVKGTMKREP